MTKYKLDALEMGYYQTIVDRHLVSMLARDGVLRFGVGYKMVNSEVTDTISLVALVNKKQSDVSQSNRVPSSLDGVDTDVIGVLPLTTQAALAGFVPDRNKRYDPIMGGMPIRNPKIGVDHVGVLGAVVFDEKTGGPMGLSVQHAIGNQTKGRQAEKGNPIYQPLTYPPVEEEKIGQLLRFDEDFDAALFEIQGNRKFEAKMFGQNENEAFELNEARMARIGQEVECPARRTYTRGKVSYYLSHIVRVNRVEKRIRTVVIEFSKGYTPTQSGDSGAVWVDSKSRYPIALHRGIFDVHLPSGRKTTAAYGTCMEQLADWGKFRFSQPKPVTIAAELAGFEVGVVQNGTEWTVFCDKPGTADRLLIKKYDRNLSFVEQFENEIYPMNGVAAAAVGNNIYAAWRSGNNDQIQIGKLNAAGNELIDLVTLSIRTRRKPALIQHNGQLFIVYADSDTQSLCVANSSDPSNRNSWSRYEVSNVKTKQAPAVTIFNNKMYFCWIDLNNNIRIGTSYGRNQISYVTSLDPKKSCLDPAIAVFDGKLCLAYTTLTGELRVVESSNLSDWTIRKSDDEQKLVSPSIFVADNQLICVR